MREHRVVVLPLSCRVQGVQGELGLWGKGEIRCCGMATAMGLVSLVAMCRPDKREGHSRLRSYKHLQRSTASKNHFY